MNVDPVVPSFSPSAGCRRATARQPTPLWLAWLVGMAAASVFGRQYSRKALTLKDTCRRETPSIRSASKAQDVLLSSSLLLTYIGPCLRTRDILTLALSSKAFYRPSRALLGQVKVRKPALALIALRQLQPLVNLVLLGEYMSEPSNLSILMNTAPFLTPCP